jgi:H+-transporting ATPase
MRSHNALSGTFNPSNEERKWRSQFKLKRLREKKNNPFMKFLIYFWGPLPWMVLGALILTGVFRFWHDFFLLLFLFVVNGLITFWLVLKKGRRSKPIGG